MNRQDREALKPVIDALRTVRRPLNPMDIKGVVKNLQEAERIAKMAASVIEDCGYGEYELALETAAEIGGGDRG